jgi:hypothetical protein
MRITVMASSTIKLVRCCIIEYDNFLDAMYLWSCGEVMLMHCFIMLSNLLQTGNGAVVNERFAADFAWVSMDRGEMDAIRKRTGLLRAQQKSGLEQCGLESNRKTRNGFKPTGSTRTSRSGRPPRERVTAESLDPLLPFAAGPPPI